MGLGRAATSSVMDHAVAASHSDGQTLVAVAIKLSVLRKKMLYSMSS
jgi:hypothetical protein